MKMNLPVNIKQYAANTKVTDWTLVDSDGVKYSEKAKTIKTFPDGTNDRLYNHMDFALTDHSLAGQVRMALL